MSKPPAHLAPEAASDPYEKIAQAFIQIRHDVNNAFAVLFALAELSQLNPDNASRLTSAMLEKGPLILQKLNEFQELLATLSHPDPSR
jgi:hypothetical protein